MRLQRGNRLPTPHAPRLGHLGMKIEFSGSFAAGGVESELWTCGVCSTRNELTERCKLCSRERHPEWLRMGNAGEEQWILVLGAHVLYRFHDFKFPAVVTAIDAIQKSITIVVMVLKAKADNYSRSREAPLFKEVVIPRRDIQATLVRPLPTDDALTSASARLSDFAICKDCRGIFHVCPTALCPPDDNSRESFAGEKQKLEELERRRQALIQSKQYEQVLVCTDEIKAQKRVVQIARRGQEYLSRLTCPLCGFVG